MRNKNSTELPNAPAQHELAAWVRDARQRTLELVADLTDDQLAGPRLAIVNPLLWEIGHVAWFQEHWVLEHAHGLEPLRADAEALYDSAAVAHDTRWDLFLPTRRATLEYLCGVRDRVLELLERRKPTAQEAYFVMLSVFHEDMHDEAFTYTRQTHGYSAPRLAIGGGSPEQAVGPLQGDVEIAGGSFVVGAEKNGAFVFDNEKWAHTVELPPFAIAQAGVTQEEFLEFVEAGGYVRPELWSPEGEEWRRAAGAEHPVYWRRESPGRWLRRNFDRWIPLEPHRPVSHVNWYEAEAYCRLRGRRLPTEAEWEVAASAEGRPSEGVPPRRRRFPWGNSPPGPQQANLEWSAMGVVDVGALPEGDSAFGCRQMIGNVWEWTASEFLPYPGFTVDPYKEYSVPWFGTHKVLRGGCWTTRRRLLRSTWRNFYTPDRRDVWAGFRTCAL